MARRSDAVPKVFNRCQWVNLHEALHFFGTFAGKTQSAEQIKPLHWYVASRLVLEGGFHPDDIWPRPPFTVSERNGKKLLHYDPDSANGKERTILGGMKTKDVDVVVTKDGIGPVLAVSCKGVTGAFRNLTNRMEETIGECTNLHITYPALVLGYFCVIRANRHIEAAASEVAPDIAGPTAELAANDIAIAKGGEAVEGLIRFHAAMREMQGRRGIRDELSRYEAIALAMVEPKGSVAGDVLDTFPPFDSPVRIENFFDTLYARYSERFVLAAPSLQTITRRIEWSTKSPVLNRDASGLPAFPELDYEPNLDEDSV